MKRLALIFLLALSVRAEDVLTHIVTVQPSGVTAPTPLAIPANTWVDVTQNASFNGFMYDYMTYYDKSLWVPAISMWCHLGSWREHSSEPNRSWMCYDPSENRIAVWSFGSWWHNEEFPEGGHPLGDLNIDPTSQVAFGKCCSSGSQASDFPFIGGWAYDFFGYAGRMLMPIQVEHNDDRLAEAAYDPFGKQLVEFSSVNNNNTSTYISSTNARSINVQTSGPTYRSDPAMVINNFDKNIYMFGGYVSGLAAVTTELWKCAYPCTTWTQLSPTCNTSLRTGIANSCPTARMGASLTYDDNENLIFMSGGCLNGGPQGSSQNGPQANDLWIYDPVANAWTELNPICQSTSYCANGNNLAGGPLYNNGAPAMQRFQYAKELDMFWLSTQSGLSNGTRRIWLYRYVPGAPVNTAIRNHTYTINSPAAEARAVGVLNRNSTCSDQTGQTCGATTCASGSGNWLCGQYQSHVLDGEIASNGTVTYQMWTETGLQPSNANYYANPYFQTWDSVNGLKQLGTTFSAITGDSTGALASAETAVAIVGTTPWACFDAQSTSIFERVTCKGWDTAGWNIGGTIPNVNGNQNSNNAYDAYPAITSVNGTPTVAYIERCDLPCNNLPRQTFGYVWQWNGTSWGSTPLGNTQILHNAPAANGTVARVPHVDSISITSDGTNPWVGWTEYQTQESNDGSRYCFDNNGLTLGVGCPNATHPRVYLTKWTGSAWSEQCGGSGNVNDAEWAFWANVTYMGAKAYVAFVERTVTGYPKLYVRSCDGTSWATIGSTYLNRDNSTGWAYRPEITNDGTNLFVTWAEQGNNNAFWNSTPTGVTGFSQRPRVYASQWNGTTWSKLGGTLNVDPQYGAARHPSIAVMNGQPVVQWNETTTGNLAQMYVKQWNGTDWVGLQPPVFQFTTGSPLPSGTQGVPYSATAQTANGVNPVTFCTLVTGSLPNGISMAPSGSTCAFSGTPTVLGTFNFGITATDSASNVTATTNYAITIVSAFTITGPTSPLPNATVPNSYSVTVTTSGGIGNLSACTVISGTTPSWMTFTLSGTTCILGGTPNLVANYSFTLQVTDSSSNNASQAYTLNVGSNCQITTTSPLPQGTVGTAYSQTLATSGCSSPLSWSIQSGALPGGLSLNSSTGVISGTPTTAGTFSFTVLVQDAAAATNSVTYSLTINAAACNPPTITTSSLPGGTLNQPYSTTLAATGTAPITWSMTGNPSWASLNSSTGVLSGTPNAVGTTSITFTATNSCGAPQKALSVTISNPGNGAVIKGTVIVNQTVH